MPRRDHGDASPRLAGSRSPCSRAERHAQVRRGPRGAITPPPDRRGRRTRSHRRDRRAPRCTWCRGGAGSRSPRRARIRNSHGRSRGTSGSIDSASNPRAGVSCTMSSPSIHRSGTDPVSRVQSWCSSGRTAPTLARTARAPGPGPPMPVPCRTLPARPHRDGGTVRAPRCVVRMRMHKGALTRTPRGAAPPWNRSGNAQTGANSHCAGDLTRSASSSANCIGSHGGGASEPSGMVEA